MKARFDGGPWNGKIMEIEPCSHFRVAVPPRIECFEQLQEVPKSDMNVRHVVYLPCSSEHGFTVFRPEGSFRRDGKPVDPASN